MLESDVILATYTISTAPVIASLSAFAAVPAQLLVVTGSGFEPGPAVTVRFSDETGFALDAPAVTSTETSIVVSVPPVIDASTNDFRSGTVRVQVIDASGAASNVVPGLQIAEVLRLSNPGGTVTLAHLERLVFPLERAIRRLQTAETASGGAFATSPERVPSMSCSSGSFRCTRRSPTSSRSARR